jgi:hypothetical protein
VTNGSGPRWRIDDVLARTRLDDLLDDLAGPAERAGGGRRWHCPAVDHDDHRASVTIHTDRHGHERWRCWSGDHRGDAIDLVTIRRSGSRVEAIDWLASRAGMIPDTPLPPIQPRPRPPAPAVTMDPAVERYVRICAAVLWSRQGRPVRDWMAGRGFDEATLRANLVGCDPGRQLMRRQRGLPYGKVPAATFPALGPTGQVRFVQARYLDAAAAGRKYDNPSQALAPNPRMTFTATPAPTHSTHLLVCEGMPDALTAAQGGYRAVGLLGAQAPDHSVAARIANYALQHQLEVVIVCDADDAGRAAGEHLAELLLAEDAGVPAVTEPPDTAADGQPITDLNDWALTESDWASQLDQLLNPAPSPIGHGVDDHNPERSAGPGVSVDLDD